MIGRSLLAMAAALTVSAGAGRVAVAEEAVPSELEGISIVPRPGAVVPRDIALRDSSGQAVTLGSYLDGKRPVVLMLAYYRCPMLCSLVVNGATAGLKDLSWSAGKDYRVLVVSFDPRDATRIARDKRDSYHREYGRPVEDGGFEFLTGTEGEVRRLADAVGFGYRWDEATQQYAHAAGAFVLTPEGKLSQTLWGIEFPAKVLRLALVEASQGKLGNAWDQVLLFCYHYDSSARGYVLAATRLMRAAGAASVLLLGIWLWRLWRPRRPGSGPGEAEVGAGGTGADAGDRGRAS